MKHIEIYENFNSYQGRKEFTDSEINYYHVKLSIIFSFCISLFGILLPLNLIRKIEPAEILKSF